MTQHGQQRHIGDATTRGRARVIAGLLVVVVRSRCRLI
jgi:hypothetical protein